jgi:hypothetical protein
MRIDMGDGTRKSRHVSDVLRDSEMKNVISTIPPAMLENFVTLFFYGVIIEDFVLTDGGASAEFTVTRQSLNEANRYYYYLNEEGTPLETADMADMMKTAYANIMEVGKGDRIYLIEANPALEGGDLEELSVILRLGQTQMA